MRQHGLLLSVLCLCAVTAGCNRTSGFLHNDLGQRQFKKGNHAEAARYFRMAAADAPDNANYAHNLGVAKLKQAHPAQAEQLFRHALEVNPMHQPSYHSLASLLKDQQRHAEAQSTLAMWSETQPYLAEPHIELAWLSRETGNASAVEHHLRQALKVEPSNATALAHLGQVYDDQGRSSEAVAMYRRSLYQDWNQHGVKSRIASLTGQPTRHPYPTGARLARPVAVPQFATTPVYAAPRISAAPVYGPPQAAVGSTRGWTGTPQTQQAITLLPPIPAQDLSTHSLPAQARESNPWVSSEPVPVGPAEPEWADAGPADYRISSTVPLVEAH